MWGEAGRRWRRGHDDGRAMEVRNELYEQSSGEDEQKKERMIK